ncbi:hypothetical protein EV363DRAFT_1305677 [Boletus edulis]|nr:hypothetical protein EV363DRAFT_1305677 [Boletus edulis]
MASSHTARPLLPARYSPRAIIMPVDPRLVRTAIGDHFPQSYLLRPFCVELFTSPYDRENRVVVGVTYRKLVDNWSASQHESIILHTAVMSPNAVGAKEVPPGPPSRRYIEVARFSDPSLLIVAGTARDQVYITEHNPISDHNRRERLGEIVWQSYPPSLVDVFAIIKRLSIRYPQYDIFLRQCYWFARMIHDTLVEVYPHGLRTFGQLFWKGGRLFGFPVPSQLTSPPADIIACARFEKECADSDRARLGVRVGTNGRRRAASI